MKKISLVLLSLTMAFLLCLSGCTKEAPSVTPPTDDATTDPKTEDQGASENIPPVENSTRIPPEEENPESDFTWQTGEGNTVTITKYVGTDTTVVVPAEIKGKNVVEIGRAAFAITEIESIFLPDSVTIIGPSAFEGCLELKKVDMSNYVKNIDGAAFRGCSALTKIETPIELVTLGNNAFANCTGLEEVKLSSAPEFFGFSCFQECGSLKTVDLPKNLTIIPDGTFSSCGLNEINLEKGLKSIGVGAFQGTKLKKVVLPESLENLGARAFQWCLELEEINIPSKVSILENSVFDSCEKLNKITLNDGLISVEKAFYGTAITEIILPKTITEVTQESFRGVKNLQAVKFEGDAPEGYTERIENDENYADYVIYYHQGAKGFTSPEWNGFKTEIW